MRGSTGEDERTVDTEKNGVNRYLESRKQQETSL